MWFRSTQYTKIIGYLCGFVQRNIQKPYCKLPVKAPFPTVFQFLLREAGAQAQPKTAGNRA